MSMTDAQWTTYDEAAVRLGISPDAVRRRAARGHWARMPGNDGRTRIQIPEDVSAPRRGDVVGDTAPLVSALEAHIATLKIELASEKERSASAAAELKTIIERLTVELTGERAARQAELAEERAAHQNQLAAERAARQADQDQLAAAIRAADRGTVELVELARRLAEIAESRPAAAEPELPRRGAAGRAWRWFLRN
jgi:hypothetical protein